MSSISSSSFDSFAPSTQQDPFGSGEADEDMPLYPGSPRGSNRDQTEDSAMKEEKEPGQATANIAKDVPAVGSSASSSFSSSSYPPGPSALAILSDPRLKLS